MRQVEGHTRHQGEHHRAPEIFPQDFKKRSSSGVLRDLP